MAYQFNNPEIEIGTMYGILKEQDHLAVVSNIIFKIVITDYYISIDPNKERIALFEESPTQITGVCSRWIYDI